MKVGASKAECADTCATGCAVNGKPRLFFCSQVKGCFPACYLFKGVRYLDGGGDDLVMQSKGGLDQPCNSGCCLGVADLRLDRAKGAPRGDCFTIDLPKGRNLHGVSNLSPCAVCLDKPYAPGGDPGLGIGIEKGLFLPAGARRVDRLALAITGGANAADHCIDPVVVAFRVGQALDHHNAETFAQDGPVPRGIERLCIAAGREGRCFAEAHVHEDIIEGIHPAGDNHIRFTCGKFQTGKVKGAEGAGAGSVNNAVGPSQVVLLAYPSCHHIAEQSGEGIFLPGDVGVRNPLDHIVGNGVVNPCFF